MASIWVLEQGEYSDYRVVGVFSSEANARRVCELMKQGYDKPEIDERLLDPSIEELNAGLSQWICRMQRDGTVIECNLIELDPCSSATFIIFHHAGLDGMLQGYAVWAKDQDHAIKITNEKRTQMIANGEWK